MAKAEKKDPKSRFNQVADAIRATTELLREAGTFIEKTQFRTPGQPPSSPTSRLPPLEVLGLAEDATGRQINDRYRYLAKAYHSDLNRAGDVKMKELNGAMDELRMQGRVR